jgi:uncharacterized membrane protein
MSLLLVGILLWTLVHFIPVFASKFRGKITEKIGLGPYKGLLALSLIGAIALMVIGWRAYPEIYYYPQAEGMREVSFILVFVGIILFVASGVKTNLKRYLRHPQLTGVMIWAFAHLLSNGEARAVILFSGFFIWALVMKMGINKRDGVWEKPQAVSVMLDIKVLIAAVPLYALLTYLHQYFTGIALV